MPPDWPARPSTSIVLALLLLLAGGCGQEPAADANADRNREGDSPAIIELDAPTAPGSMAPNLTVAPHGAVYLSWLAPTDDGGHALRFATLAPAANSTAGRSMTWSQEQTVMEAGDLFVNWADFPAMAVLDNGHMAAHWLRRSGPDTYDYDIEVAWSLDGGDTWGEPVKPHQDGTASEHGFVSLFPWDHERLGILWLDGRHFAGWDEKSGRLVEGHRPADPEMSLRATVLTPDGPGEESLLDARTCECCQTSVVQTSRGPVAFYRDRSDAEIRDIASIRYRDGSWTAPVTVHDDGWEVRGCPVNGPMASSEADRVAVAWFTAADGKGRVNLAFSDDAGATFAAPLRVDDGQPIGRVAVALDDEEAWVTWMEAVPGGADIRLRRINADGTFIPAQVIAGSSAARASGFPRLVRSDRHLLLAWTSPGPTPRVMTAAIDLGNAGVKP